MNYVKIYNNLIISRKHLNRTKNNGLYEEHHIRPRCLGGTDEKENLILLTPKEHYVAHWLLYKQHSGKEKATLSYAFFCMCRNNDNQKRTVTSRQYELTKTYMSKSTRGQNHPSFGKKYPKEFCQNISDRMTGTGNHRYGKRPWNYGLTKETSKILKTISENTKNRWKGRDHPSLGYKHTDQTREKMSKNMKGIPKSQEHKDKLSKALKGKHLSEKTRQKMSAARKGISQKVIKCPYCNTEGGIPSMKRWHFENCKFK